LRQIEAKRLSALAFLLQSFLAITPKFIFRPMANPGGNLMSTCRPLALLSLILAPTLVFADDNYCRSAEPERSNWGMVEELAEAAEAPAEDGETYLVQLEDGSEILLSGVTEEDNIGDEEIFASAKKPKKKGKKKGKRYTNRGILPPKGKWPVGKGGCTTLTGQASFYGGGEKLKKRTASGKVFSGRHLSAAHRTLPLGTKVEITNVNNGKKISSVVINDRGPAIETKREIDVTKAVAQKLGFVNAGHTRVKVKVCRS
jgi:rare lipoprotein A